MKYMPFIQMTRRTKEITDTISSENIIPYISLVDINEEATEKKSLAYNESEITGVHFVDYTDHVMVLGEGIPVVNMKGKRRYLYGLIRDAQNTYEQFGIRLHTQDFTKISTILDTVFETETLHIIIEIGNMSNGINRDTIEKILQYADDNSLDIQLYILASSIPENLNTVCTTNSRSVIDNQALLAFNDLMIDDDRINFGDYCGYEVSTPSEYVIGMRIVPKTIMLSTNSSQILIVRTCNIEYKWKQGMTELLDLLKTDSIYDNFTHPIEECEGCGYLLNPALDKSTPEFIKVACMKHNIRSMADFVEYYNSRTPDDFSDNDFF